MSSSGGSSSRDHWSSFEEYQRESDFKLRLFSDPESESDYSSNSSDITVTMDCKIGKDGSHEDPSCSVVSDAEKIVPLVSGKSCGIQCFISCSSESVSTQCDGPAVQDKGIQCDLGLIVSSSDNLPVQRVAKGIQCNSDDMLQLELPIGTNEQVKQDTPDGCEFLSLLPPLQQELHVVDGVTNSVDTYVCESLCGEDLSGWCSSCRNFIDECNCALTSQTGPSVTCNNDEVSCSNKGDNVTNEVKDKCRVDTEITQEQEVIDGEKETEDVTLGNERVMSNVGGSEGRSSDFMWFNSMACVRNSSPESLEEVEDSQNQINDKEIIGSDKRETELKKGHGTSHKNETTSLDVSNTKTRDSRVLPAWFNSVACIRGSSPESLENIVNNSNDSRCSKSGQESVRRHKGVSRTRSTRTSRRTYQLLNRTKTFRPSSSSSEIEEDVVKKRKKKRRRIRSSTDSSCTKSPDNPRKNVERDDTTVSFQDISVRRKELEKQGCSKDPSVSFRSIVPYDSTDGDSNDLEVMDRSPAQDTAKSRRSKDNDNGSSSPSVITNTGETNPSVPLKNQKKTANLLGGVPVSDSDCESISEFCQVQRRSYTPRGTRRSNSPRGMRRFYTGREQMQIIRYIVQKRKYHMVKGTELWRQMEADQVCAGRTWQSLKEHFRKQILPRIEVYRLDSDVEERFKRVRN